MTPIFTFYIAFHILVVGERRDLVDGLIILSASLYGQQTDPERGVVTLTDQF